MSIVSIGIVACANLGWLWASVTSPAGHGDGGIEFITPVSPMFMGDTSGKTGLLWMLINFVVLMLILDKLMFSKLRARTTEKHDQIKAELERASTARTRAEALLEQIRQRMGQLDGEVEQMRRAAEARAAADREQILAEARIEAERIRTAAKTAAEREGLQRRRELEREIVDRAIVQAEALLRQRLTALDQQRMVESFVRDVAGQSLDGSVPTEGGKAA